MLWGANVRHDQSASRFKLEDQKAKRCHKRRREHVTDGKKGCNKGSSRGFTTFKFILRSAYDSYEERSQAKYVSYGHISRGSTVSWTYRLNIWGREIRVLGTLTYSSMAWPSVINSSCFNFDSIPWIDFETFILHSKFEQTKDQRSTEAQDGPILARWWNACLVPVRVGPDFLKCKALVRVGPELTKMFGPGPVLNTLYFKFLRSWTSRFWSVDPC